MDVSVMCDGKVMSVRRNKRERDEISEVVAKSILVRLVT